MSDLETRATPETSGGIESHDSMDSTIAEAWAGIQQSITDEGGQPDDTPASGRDNKTGRFTKKQEKAATAQAAQTDTDTTLEDKGATEQPGKAEGAEETAQTAATQAEGKRAPNTWKKEAQEQFAALPPMIQDEVLRREADFHKGIEGYKAQAEAGKKFEQLVSPYMETIRKLGVTPDVAVSALLNADNILRTAPPAVKQQYFRELANQYGIDLAQEVDPNIAALQAEVFRLSQQTAQYQRSQAQAVQSSFNSELERFAAEPGHEHFQQVRNHMASLIEGGHATDLQDAYDQAVYANPQTRAALLAKQREDQQKELARKATEARKAASVNVPTRGVIPAAGPKRSMDDTIRAEAERLGLA